MADVQSSDVDVIPSPFSLAEQWVTIGKHSWCKRGNEGIWFTVEQEESIAGLECEVQWCNHGNQDMLFTAEQKGSKGITAFKV
jgi:hypothetical protein